MKQVKAFKCSDGIIRENLDDAIAHELGHELCNRGILRHGAALTHMQLLVLVQNRDLVVSMLSKLYDDYLYGEAEQRFIDEDKWEKITPHY